MGENYHFEDFTESNYIYMLNLIKDSYNTIFFHDYKIPGKNLLLRHDVDCSIHRAYRLAQIEAENNIYSTFFLWMHSPLYNIFENDITDLVNRIINLGHEIGLHFDVGFYDRRKLDHDTILEYLVFEKDILEKLFQRPITVFSFHEPSDEVIKCYTVDSYYGMINTYSLYLRDHYGYCSDSNGYWRFRRLEDVLIKADAEKLQVLLHPEWWTLDVLSPRQRISRCIDGRCRKNHEQYDKLLKYRGRLNVR
jgi:hypothetical protein